MWSARCAAIVLLAGCASSSPPPAPGLAPSVADDPAVGDTLRPPAPGPLIAAGANHTCASTTDGGLECWGAGTAGQLGDGAFRSRGSAVRVLYVRDPVLLAAGDAHTCAQDARRRLHCWGKLGGDEASTAFPVRVERGPFVALGAGADVTCGLAPSGMIDCWGDGGESRVEAPPRLTAGDRLCAADVCFAIDPGGARAVARVTGDGPAPPADLGPIDAQVNGRAHACARTAGGIRCWGDDTHGQLGQGASLPRLGHWDPVPGLADAVGLAATSSRVCAVRRSGSVVCWGAVVDDETFDATAVTLQPAPAAPGVDTAVSIAADGASMCAALRDGAAVCWDAGLAGDDADPPARVAGVAGAVTIGLGEGLACTTNRAGQVSCWVPHDDRPARRVPGLPAIRDLQVAHYRGCGVDRQQRLWCWDADSRAQQPRFARRTCRGGPRYLDAHQGEISEACTQAGDAPLIGVRSVVLSGGLESMSVLHALVGTDGVFAYADTETGESAAVAPPPGAPRGPPAFPRDYVEPFPLPAGTSHLVGDLSAGCAVTAAGAVHCWGGPFGQVPITTSLPPPTALAASDELICALVDGGQVRCQLIGP